MLDNLSIFKNYNNLDLDFNNNLKIKDSLLFNNCSNFNIIINSKINKITINKCSNFRLSFVDTISGIDIDKSIDVEIIRLTDYKNEHSFNYINCFLSTINFSNINLHLLNNTRIINENSKNTFKNY